MTEFETGVIGCLVIDANRTLAECADAGVKEDWFGDSIARVLFKEVERMQQTGKPVGLINIAAHLRETNKYHEDAVQAAEHAYEQTPTIEHVAHYIGGLRRDYLRRLAKERCAELCSRIDGESPEDCIVDISKQLLDATVFISRKDIGSIREDLKDKWRRAASGDTSGIPSPWRTFNKRFGGLHPGTVTLFAGRGGKGKSSAIATWAEFLGGLGVRVGWKPLEDGVERTFARLSSINGEFSTFQLDSGNVPPDELDDFLENADRSMQCVQQMPIFMDDRYMTIEQIFAWTIRMKAVHDIQVLFIDAFKDILRKKRDLSEDEHISRTICELARRANIPILVNHHVRKGSVDSNDYDRLTFEDIRSSGQIANDARQIILLQNMRAGDGTEVFEFEIAKNNYGPTGTFPMIRMSKFTKWIEPIQ